MKTLLLVIVSYGLAFGAVAEAEEAEAGDETLAFFLSKTEIVLVGELLGTEEPHVGVKEVNTFVEVKVSNTLMGERHKSFLMDRDTLVFRAMQVSKDHAPYFRKGAKCIFPGGAQIGDRRPCM
jgi:hypothetical protein